MKNNQLEKLSDYADYSKAKISIAEIDTKCYFSTENMLPNKGGVTEAAGLPTQDNVTKVLPENVLVSNIRPYFKKIYFANELAGASNDVLCFVAKNGCLPRYLYYLLSSDSFFDYMMAGAKGTKMPRGDKGQIMNFPVWVPAQNEQSRIVSVLSALDEKIENISKINHNLEEQAKAIFKSWFIDFEPFRDGEFVDSELGQIPAGWQVGTLKDMLEVRYGKEHKKLADGAIPVYGSGGLMRHVEKALYNGESVLIPRKGTLNNVMRVTGEFWTVDTMFYSVPRKTGAAKYLYHILSKLDLTSMNSGSAVPSMTTDILNAIKIILPPDKVLKDFDYLTSFFWESIETKKMEMQKLAQLRDALLPELMSGEIDVSKVQV
ncbi:restriction endonuclease subunit S [Victivallis vadensis]|nr:restriction endonuclease subunit S [Victivallis vadensis]